MVVVGVLGKSNEAHCNKLLEFNMLHSHPSLTDEAGIDVRLIFFFLSEQKHFPFIHRASLLPFSAV